jgi:hypothetical protein
MLDDWAFRHVRNDIVQLDDFLHWRDPKGHFGKAHAAQIKDSRDFCAL